MKRVLLAALFLAAFGLYARTLYPAFALDDSPWTIAAAVNLGVQHAPGYPVLTLLGKIATALPVGSPSFRVNLFSAALGAGGGALTAAIAAVLFSGTGGLAAAAVAGALLAVSRVWWECALSAKGGLYLLNYLAIAGASLALVRKGSRGACLAAFLCGLGLAGHWMTVVWWLPVVAVAGAPWDRRRAAAAVLVAALGMSLYVSLPLCAAREPVWGDPATARGLADAVMRRSFLPQAAMKPASFTWAQLGYGLLTPVREGGIAFALLALAGCAALWRDRRRALLVTGAGPLLALAAVAFVTNPVHITTGELYLWLSDRFHLPYLGALAAASAAGILLLRCGAGTRGGRAVLPAAASLPVLLAAGRFAALDHSYDYLGHDYARNMVAGLSLPATVFAEADYQSFPLCAPLYTDRAAPGLAMIVTNPFLDRPAGWRRLSRTLPAARGLEGEGEPLRGRPDAASNARVVALADRLLAAGPVYNPSMCSYPGLRQRLAFHGLLFEVGPPGSTGKPPEAAAVARGFARLRLRGLWGEYPHKDGAAFSVLDGYGQLLAMPGQALFRAGKLDRAAAALRAALVLPGQVGRALILMNLGHSLARLARYSEAESAFRDAARLEPRNLDLWTNVATACAAQGNTGEAMRLFGWVLARNPRHASALQNLDTMRRRLGGRSP